MDAVIRTLVVLAALCVAAMYSALLYLYGFFWWRPNADFDEQPLPPELRDYVVEAPPTWKWWV